MGSEIVALYQNFQNFEQGHAVAKDTAEKFTGNVFDMQAILSEDLDKLSENLDTGFSLMTEKEASDAQTYEEKLGIFVVYEIKTKDSSGDLHINLNEYREASLAELEKLNEKLEKETTKEEKAKKLSQSHFLFALADISRDNLLDEEELKIFYSEMDSFVEDELSDSKDGVLDIEQVNAYKEALIDKFYSKEDQEVLKEHYEESFLK